METAVRAPFAGRVREVLAGVNAQVDAGAPLLNLEQVGGDVEEASGDRVELPTVDVRDARATATARCRCSPRCRR